MPRQTYTRRATRADAANIAPKLIGPDRIEVEAIIGLPPELCLPSIIDRGAEVYASGFADTPEEVEVLWGVDPVPGADEVGIIWMLSSPSIYSHPHVLAPNIKKQWAAAHERYPILTNYTYAENTAHHKLIEWLGGRLLRRIDKFGAQSMPFYEFVSVSPCA